MKEIWLTKGMFGEKTEKIGEASTFTEAVDAIDKWKQSPTARVKIEPYNRFIPGDNGEMCVDFGDWSMFISVYGLDTGDFFEKKED